MTTSVLIVGAGPVGLTMAIELVRYGVRVRLVDLAPVRTDQSRALVIWSRSLELLERAGCSAGLVKVGYPADSVVLSTGERTIAGFTLNGLETKYPYALMIPQNETERVLEEFLNSLGVKVERPVEWTGFTTSQDQVVSVLRHPDGGQEILETSWLIGCDGAHSPVRHALGMEFCGETMLTDWILADVHLKGLPRKPEISIIWHSDGVLALFPISEQRYRVIADVGAPGAGTGGRSDPTLAEVQALLDRRFPGPVLATEPVWLSAFRINERKVADYRSGRVFLAGDAAHVHSPAGGQGMNTGMQDACNLAWKLALVVRGLAPDRILDTYTAERGPVAEQVLKITGRLTTVATATGEIARFLRDHTASLILGLPPVRRFAADIVSEISVGYPHSPLNVPPGYHDPLPGKRAPIRANEPPIGAGDTPRFVLCASTEGLPSGLLDRYDGLIEPTVREPYHPEGLWLVRPDGYVAVAARSDDWSAVTGLLDRLFVRPPTGAASR